MSLRIITHSFYRVSNLFGSNLFLLIYEALTRRPRRGCRVTSAHLRPVSRALQREGWSQRPRALLETHSIGHRIGVRFSFQRASGAPFPVGPFRLGGGLYVRASFPSTLFFRVGHFRFCGVQVCRSRLGAVAKVPWGIQRVNSPQGPRAGLGSLSVLPASWSTTPRYWPWPR